MEFKIAVEELKKALHRAQGIVERKTTMPILANVLVNADKDGVSVTAFDLDIGIVSRHPAEVMKPGAVTLSARYLFDITANLPDSHVTLRKLPNNFAEISSGAAHYKLVGMAPEEYPRLPRDDAGSLTPISGATFLEMIRKVSYAISTDETRYILNGVYFEPRDGGRIRMVATDGHRLSMVERESPGDFKLKAGVIIPRKGLAELKRLLEEAPEAECQFGFAENSAIFKKPGLSMVMRLIDGQFPEYQRVIPQSGDKQFSLSRLRLVEALKRIALLSTDKTSAVKFTLLENVLRIFANNPDLGEARDDLTIAYRGAELTVGFNARYMLDVLGATDTDEVVVELGDDHSPALLHGPGDKSFLSVVMPVLR